MSKNSESRLQQINQILEKAFFAPLHINDWLGFHFNQPFLLGLGQDEMTDIFARSALADERLHAGQSTASETAPLERLLQCAAPAKVLAHGLASLKDDRPFLFHRTLASIPAIVQGDLEPEDFDSVEDMLEEALSHGLELAAGAAQEIDGLRRQALALLGPAAEAKVAEQVKRLLESEQLLDIKNENQLRLWLAVGSGREGVQEDILPHVLIEAWAAWSGAVTGAKSDAALLMRSLPELAMSSQQIESYMPPLAGASPSISSTCPYCQGGNVINVGQDKIEASHRCAHLVFIGTNDPMHLLRVLILSPASIGEDTLQLLDSYYQSVPDLNLFANIVSDFYQMLVNQDRIKESPVMGQGAPFSHLRAYFSQTMPAQKDS